jgi:hypothetical protein
VCAILHYLSAWVASQRDAISQMLSPGRLPATCNACTGTQSKNALLATRSYCFKVDSGRNTSRTTQSARRAAFETSFVQLADEVRAVRRLANAAWWESLARALIGCVLKYDRVQWLAACQRCRDLVCPPLLIISGDFANLTLKCLSRPMFLFPGLQH